MVNVPDLFLNLPTTTFTTLVMDPPWRFRDRVAPGAPEDLKHFRYRTLSVSEIQSFPVQRLSSENSHLYLWAPTQFLPDAWGIIGSWGFTVKQQLVWIKRAKNGGYRYGLGRYFRNVHETCLFAVKGKLQLKSKGLVTVIEALHVGHSKKPDAFYKLVEAASPGPYIDLFARQERSGWAVWGEEVEKHIPTS